MKKKILAILVFLTLVYGLALTSSAISPEVLTTSGTWTVPLGVTEITVELIGGGGGSKAPGYDNSGSGGGAGGLYYAATMSVKPGETFNYKVGSGGLNTGGKGGTTEWYKLDIDSDITMFAGGGNGATGTLGASCDFINNGSVSYGPTRTVYNVFWGVGGNGADSSGLNGGGGGAGGSGDGDGNFIYYGNAKGNIGGLGFNNFCGNGGTGGISASGTNGLNYGGGAGGSYRTSTGGNTGQSGAPGAVRITYTVSDVTPPSAPSVMLNPNADWVNTAVNVTITPGVDEPGGSGSAVTTYTTQLNDGMVSGETIYTEPFQITEEGTTVIKTKTYDNAGNVSAITEKTVKIDLMNPTAPFFTVNPNKDWSNTAVNVTITPGTDIAGGSGTTVTTYTTQFNVGTESGETTYTEPILITEEGTTVIKTKTYDNAGNVSAVTEETVKIDKTKPTVLYNGVEYTDGDNINLGYITTGFAKSVSYTKLDEASGFENTEGIESIPTDIPGLGLEHDMTVTDRAGNSAVITFIYKVISMNDLMSLLTPVTDIKTYTINSNIPVKLQITENGISVPMSANDLTFALRMFSSDGGIVTPIRTNKVDLNNSWFTLAADGLIYQYNLSTKGLAKGIYTLEIFIKDKAFSSEGLVGTINLTLR